MWKVYEIAIKDLRYWDNEEKSLKIENDIRRVVKEANDKKITPDTLKEYIDEDGLLDTFFCDKGLDVDGFEYWYSAEKFRWVK